MTEREMDDWRNRNLPAAVTPYGTEREATEIETKAMDGAVAFTMRRVGLSGAVFASLHVVLTPAEMRELMTDGYAAASEAETRAERLDAGRWDNRRKA